MRHARNSLLHVPAARHPDAPSLEVRRQQRWGVAAARWHVAMLCAGICIRSLTQPILTPFPFNDKFSQINVVVCIMENRSMSSRLRLYGLRKFIIRGIGIGAAVCLLIACTAISIPEPNEFSAAATPVSSLRIATSTGFIADWVSHVGGNQMTVTPILPEGADPHDHLPGPQDVALLSQSDLVYQVGLGLEAAWVTDLIENVNGDSTRVIAVGELVDVLSADPDEPAAEHPDPHFWLDPLRVKSVVSAMATHLSDLEPAQAVVFQERAAAYNAELDALHAWILVQVESIPAEQRLLVTGHDFMQYFAQRYGFAVVGSMTGDTSTDHAHEAPAHDLAELVLHMQELKVRAIFTEYGHENELAQTIAEEVDIQAVIPLYTGSLGPQGSGADSYIGMMRANVEALVEALQ